MVGELVWIPLLRRARVLAASLAPCRAARHGSPVPSIPSTPPSGPPPAGPPSTHASVAPELRRHLLRMVIGIVVLDALVLVVKSRLLVDAWPMQRRMLFTAAWMMATLAIVMTSLARIRAIRVRARRARVDPRV